MSDINLLPGEEKSVANFDNLYKKILLLAIGLVVLTAVVTIAVLAFYSIMSSTRSGLITRVSTSSATISGLKPVEELAVVVKQKTSIADKILSARSPMGDIFSTLVQLVPQNVYFTDMRFSGVKVIISGKARSSADVAGLVSQLISPRGNGIFSQVSVDSLASDATGAYSFVISANLLK